MHNFSFKMFVFISTLNFFTFCALAQIKDSRPTNLNIILDKNKPSVYLTFEKTGKRKPKHTGESDEGIWLRLHNNTIWAIDIYTENYYEDSMFSPLLICDVNTVGLLDGLEVAPLYTVEAFTNSGIAPKINRGHMTLDPSIWLPSGRSLVFSVPREHLAKYLKVIVSFSYEWEFKRLEGGRLDRDAKEPLHNASFFNYELP